MARTTYRCDGCHAVLETKDDLSREQGTTRSAWKCGYCGTSIPGIVGEKLKHQE